MWLRILHVNLLWLHRVVPAFLINFNNVSIHNTNTLSHVVHFLTGLDLYNDVLLCRLLMSGFFRHTEIRVCATRIDGLNQRVLFFQYANATLSRTCRLSNTQFLNTLRLKRLTKHFTFL